MARRNDQSRMTEAELAITATVELVESLGCDQLLTEATTLLLEARDRVDLDYEEMKELRKGPLAQW